MVDTSPKSDYGPPPLTYYGSSATSSPDNLTDRGKENTGNRSESKMESEQRSRRRSFVLSSQYPLSKIGKFLKKQMRLSGDDQEIGEIDNDNEAVELEAEVEVEVEMPILQPEVDLGRVEKEMMREEKEMDFQDMDEMDVDENDQDQEEIFVEHHLQMEDNYSEVTEKNQKQVRRDVQEDGKFDEFEPVILEGDDFFINPDENNFDDLIRIPPEQRSDMSEGEEKGDEYIFVQQAHIVLQIPEKDGCQQEGIIVNILDDEKTSDMSKPEENDLEKSDEVIYEEEIEENHFEEQGESDLKGPEDIQSDSDDEPQIVAIVEKSGRTIPIPQPTSNDIIESEDMDNIQTPENIVDPVPLDFSSKAIETFDSQQAPNDSEKKKVRVRVASDAEVEVIDLTAELDAIEEEENQAKEAEEQRNRVKEAEEEKNQEEMAKEEETQVKAAEEHHFYPGPLPPFPAAFHVPVIVRASTSSSAMFPEPAPSLESLFLVIPGKPRRFECLICHAQFKSSNHRKYHAATHGYSKLPYKCGFCGRQYFTQSQFQYHLLLHLGEKPYPCAICGTRFISASKLSRHILTHNTDYNFQCNTCTKRFNNPYSLESHMNIHASIRAFKCTQCDKAFRTAATCKKHEQTHNPSKPFECHVCQRRFAGNKRLQTHMLIHIPTEDRQFQCDKCRMGFYNKKDLHRHLITHTGVQPYICIFCRSSFNRKDNFERHIVQVHPEVPQDSVKQMVERGHQNVVRRYDEPENIPPRVQQETEPPEQAGLGDFNFEPGAQHDPNGSGELLDILGVSRYISRPPPFYTDATPPVWHVGESLFEPPLVQQQYSTTIPHSTSTPTQ